MPGKKKAGDNLTKGQRRDQMARKRDERSVRRAHKQESKAQESYLAEDQSFQSFSVQLAKLGLQLRDIPGDGNCLFRALGDQLDGHVRNHYKHRLDVVDYMTTHRKDFEPFVEDDVPFDRHISELRKPGTYAGNDTIVAFAKLHKVNIIIHQINSPFWQVNGPNDPKAKQLHISYHNGDHYSSVRKLQDHTENPTKIHIEISGSEPNHAPKASTESNKPSSGYDASCEFYDNYDDECNNGAGFDYVEEDGVARAIRDADDIVAQVMSTTGCMDHEMVKETLQDCGYNPELAAEQILHLTQQSQASQNGYNSVSSSHSSHSMSSYSSYAPPTLWDDQGTGSRLFGEPQPQPTTQGAKPKKLSTREVKKQQKADKKMRAEERHREKFLAQNGAHHPAEATPGTTVVSSSMGMLHI